MSIKLVKQLTCCFFKCTVPKRIQTATAITALLSSLTAEAMPACQLTKCCQEPHETFDTHHAAIDMGQV